MDWTKRKAEVATPATLYTDVAAQVVALGAQVISASEVSLAAFGDGVASRLLDKHGGGI